MSEPGTRKCWSIRVESASGCNEKRSVQCAGRRKNTADRKIVTTPTSEPKVPGAFGAYPTPSAVAIASASRGFSFCVEGSGFGVIGLVQIEDDGLAILFRLLQLFFVENRIGHHIFFARPVAEVHCPAAFAAKREVLVFFGIGCSFADGAAVDHKSGSSRISDPILTQPTKVRQPSTRNGAPVVIRIRASAGTGTVFRLGSGRGSISTTRPTRSYASVFSISTRTMSPIAAISPLGSSMSVK